MSLPCKKLPGEPIVLQILDHDFHIKEQGVDKIEETLRVLDQQSQPVFFIMDVTQANFTFDDYVFGASLATRQFAVFQHPNIRESLIVTTSQTAVMAAKGLNSPVFGQIKLSIFKTLDAALDYARSAR